MINENGSYLNYRLSADDPLDMMDMLPYIYIVNNSKKTVENISLLNNTYLEDNINLNAMFSADQNALERTAYNPVYTNLVAEGDENFFHYLNYLGLTSEPNLLVLSSKHHYYYDDDDLRGVKVLINLKKLNLIKHLDSFLHIVFRVLPPKASFIGCFTDSRTTRGKGLPFSHTNTIFNRFMNFIDSRTERNLDKNEVSRLLESHGFKIIDMTEIEGRIYFTGQNKRMLAE